MIIDNEYFIKKKKIITKKRQTKDKMIKYLTHTCNRVMDYNRFIKK